MLTDHSDFFQMILGIANQPKSLYFMGNLPAAHLPTIAIIGTRKPSHYDQEVTYRLSYDLAARGVVVVSGLAFGVDSIAHQAALDAGGITIAVMPGPLPDIYPASHRALAERIVKGGGALISEYEPGASVYKINFVARNRIVAGVADGVLVTEAAIKSGTIHTAGFALTYGRPVMAVPGNITSPMSNGTNNLIKTGATPVTEVADALHAIGWTDRKQSVLPLAENAEQAAILRLIRQGIRDGDDLQLQSGLTPAEFAQTLTMLEITQKIRPLGGNAWSL